MDVIYNNAGLIDRNDHSALDLSLEAWSRVLTANFTTAWLSCKHGIHFSCAPSRPEARGRAPGGGVGGGHRGGAG